MIFVRIESTWGLEKKMEQSESDIDVRHAEKMAVRKIARDQILSEKIIEKGLLIVHTGAGKGKSTAAFGMMMRAIGHGFRVAMVQFVKGQRDSGERSVLDKFPDLVDVLAIGEGFTWETQDRQRDIASARAGWKKTQEILADASYRLVVLDELNIVLRYGYLPIQEILEGLSCRAPHCHVVVTGRNALPELIAAADLVTEMTLIKHPFRSGVKAQPGVDF
ncbi:Corrinoid adenosyltransferase [Azospirillaceae bacterium]